jgi:osmotically inducible protein OsmC
MKILYTTSATATAGRVGKVVSDDPSLNLQLSSPKSLGGPGGSGTNPEQLFAGGYAACFSSALGLVAKQKNVALGDYTITAKVSLGTAEGGKYALEVELVGDFAEIPVGQAEGLMKAAHQICPYSNATRGNVEVTLTVKVE